MPRIRSVKPDIWDDDRIAELSRDARLLFVGLITQADDDGYLPGKLKWIESKVFPYDDDIDQTQIKGWVRELSDTGLVWAYEANGKPYIWLPNWDKHQKIDKRYHSPSKLPRAPDERPTSAPRDPHEASTQERIGEEGTGGDVESEVVPTPDAPLSNLLADLVAANDPNGKRPNVPKAWAIEEDRMIRLDDRKPEEAERLLRWTQGNSFWRGNVLSMPKFREKYGQLYQAAVDETEKSKGKTKLSPAMQRVEQVKARREARAAA